MKNGKMRRFLAGLMCLVMVVGLMPVTAGAAELADGCYYIGDGEHFVAADGSASTKLNACYVEAVDGGYSIYCGEKYLSVITAESGTVYVDGTDTAYSWQWDGSHFYMIPETYGAGVNYICFSDADNQWSLTTDSSAALTATMVDSGSTAAITMGTKPSDGTTSGKPFIKGTPTGCNSFRIPAMVTLSDGTIVAAADARWNTTYDGGGLDTIVARSSDNGATWNYTFANYLGDNGNEYNGSGSTAFIDPALAVTANNTIYMLCDLYPYGVALNGSGNTAPVATKGFNDDGKLLLSADGSNYSYYLDGDTIYSSGENAVSGYTVDAYFNIYDTTTGAYVSNLFFADSPYKVVRTGYLYLTTSTDKGATWSAPILLNLKTNSEMVCLVGPGRGLVTSNGTIIFPVYSYNGSQESQRMGFIYSADGVNWTRVDSSINWSSESAVVELTDGTLRFFYRNGTTNLCYVDYDWTNGWTNNTTLSSIDTNSNCQISAITYSKTYNGNQVILVSCPTGPSGNGSDQSGASYRLNGKIFAFSVDGNGNMTSLDSISVASQNSTNSFMYSCLTELSKSANNADSGDIAILFEDLENDWGYADHDNDGLQAYYAMSYATYDLATELGVTFDTATDGDNDTEGGDGGNNVTVDVRIKAGETSQTYTVNGVYVSSLTGLDTNVATAALGGQQGVEATVKYTASTVTCATLLDSNSTYASTEYYVLTDSGDYYPLYVSRTSRREGKNNYYSYTYYYSTDGGTTFKEYAEQTDLRNTQTTANITVYTKTGVDAVEAYTTVAFTGVSVGETTAIVGSTQYNITVVPAEKSLSVTPGGTVSTPVTGTVTAAQIAEVNASGLVTVSSDGATLTFTGGTTEGTYGPFLLGNTQYTVTVATRGGNMGTATVAVDGSANLTIPADELFDGETVEWSVADDTLLGVAGVAGSANQGLIVGRAAGETTVTAKVKDANGNVVATYTWTVTVTGEVDTNDLRTTKLIIDIERIEHCTVYYSINGGELIKIEEKDLTAVTDDEGNILYYEKDVYINETYTNYGHGLNIAFFAAPDEGYALSYMMSQDDTYSTGVVSGNQNAEYFSIDDGNSDGTGSEAWPFDSATQTTIPSSSADDAWKNQDDDGINANSHNCYGFGWPLYEGNMTIDQWKVMVSNAISKGCDGVMQFTKNTSGTEFRTNIYVVAHKLPTVKKEISSVTYVDESNTTQNRSANTKGEWGIQLNDTVTYKITLSFPAIDTNYGGMDFTGIKLTDTLLFGSSEILFSSLSGATVTCNDSTLSASTAADGTVYYELDDQTYNNNGAAFDVVVYASFPMTYNNYATLYEDSGDGSESNLITNVADVSYTYQTDYATNTHSAKSHAEMEAYIWYGSVVIDFGLPIEISIDQIDYFEDVKTFQTATAKYGTVQMVDSNNDNLTDTLVYTPTSVAPEYDVIIYTAQPADSSIIDPFSYGVYVTNASNVLYEEGFMTVQTGSGADWVDGSVTSDASSQSSANAAPYGYDAAYASSTGASGTQYVVELTPSGDTKFADYMTFSFTGTGFDLIGACGPKTGTLMVRVDKNGSYFKSYLVDTSFTDTTYGKIYQVPLIHAEDWEFAEYTVTVTGAYIDYGQTVQTNMLGGFGFGGGNAIADVYELIYSAGLTDEQVDDVEFINMDKLYGASTYGMTDSDGNSSNGYTPPASMTLEIDGFRVYRTTTNASYKDANPGYEYNAVYFNVLEKYNSGIVAYIEATGTNTDIEYSAAEYQLAGGPQNEIYLEPGSSISFQVEYAADYQVQVSLRSVAGDKVVVNGTKDDQGNVTGGITIEHTTEMYYIVKSDTSGNVAISNTYGTLLGIGNIKIIPIPEEDNEDNGTNNASIMMLSADDYPAVFSLLRSGGSEIVDPNAVAEETPDDDKEEVEVPDIIWPTYTPSQNNVFQPEEFDMEVGSYTMFGQRFVTIKVNASTDVDKLTINGTPLWAANYIWVKQGLADEYVYTMLLIVPENEAAFFEVLAYNADGLASKVYTITD